MSNYTDKHLQAHSEPMQDTDEPIPTFMSAQLAYAKSKHSKQAEKKKQAYKKRWFKKEGKQ
ncbi:hypothetical protein [Psychrobacter sanguinis]|uniref:hypothetical protein n=1 Tax=Psychrobacter sanguinis TaxID=861445 RepID=UPI001917C146|nr:hypothetical protein [Psychrobacter sanguinis]MCC3307328.1 hypothetical protein [Psychrobacter sanguinis]